ncbi:MAG TPA: hypothetical protein VE131_02745 [Terriglobales bacterium]|nr:hypothetical protein [Terriglobales bacterium]
MKRSDKRILVTHAGSLARPADLMDMLIKKDEGQPYDREGFSKRVRGAVVEIPTNGCGVDSWDPRT